MRGLLTDLSFVSVLDLIHLTRQTGVLDVQSDIPYTIAFAHGEIVTGGILDWLGPDALFACPLAPEQGRFEFVAKPIAGIPSGPYSHFLTEWARISDEWHEICSVIGSPSQVYRGDFPLFNEPAGRSVRAAARKSEQPVFDVAKALAGAVKAGFVEPTSRFAWFGLLLNPSRSLVPGHKVTEMLNGERNLGAIVHAGCGVEEVRDYLLRAVQQGLRFPGSGWVLRDLMWEQEHRPLLTPSA